MHIGLVIYGSLDTMSGGYLYDRKLVSYLRDQGDTVDVISLPWRNYFFHLTDNLSFRLPANLDLVIEDELNHPSLLAANALPHPYPILSLVHNLHSSEKRPAWQNTFYRAVEKRYLRSVDGFIFNSSTTRDAVEVLVGSDHPASVTDKPCVVATPGGDRLGSLPPEQIGVRAAEPGPLRLLFLANVTPLKGLHILLEALSLVGSEFRLDVVGSLTVDPSYAQEMQQKVAASGFKSKIFFHGILDGDMLSQKLRQSHVLVIPSFYEGFGISYLEGMAFGLPVIGTTAGAIPQLIADRDNGFLIEPGDSRMLARHLLELSSNRELLARLSLSALQRFQSQPTWAQSDENVRSFLSQVLKERR
jgi:glycosyltransferase involved in cell wall biosynthesis